MLSLFVVPVGQARRAVPPRRSGSPHLVTMQAPRCFPTGTSGSKGQDVYSFYFKNFGNIKLFFCLLFVFSFALLKKIERKIFTLNEILRLPFLIKGLKM